MHQITPPPPSPDLAISRHTRAHIAVYIINLESYVIVIVQLSGIYGSKRTESEGDSPRTRFVYVAINP